MALRHDTPGALLEGCEEGANLREACYNGSGEGESLQLHTVTL